MEKLIEQLSVEQLKKLVENTMLIPNSIKEILFEMYPWDKELENSIRDFFKNYLEVEVKVIKFLKENKDKIFLSVLKEIEKLEKNEENKNIEKLIDTV
jgi:hypothetical protein